jgi:hypothetical protein
LKQIKTRTKVANAAPDTVSQIFISLSLLPETTIRPGALLLLILVDP